MESFNHNENDVEIYNPNIDYREEMINRYKDVELIDRTGIDDFIHDEDKKNLLRYCSHIIKKENPSFPSVMESLLVKNLYYNVIEKMNKDDYLKEKQEQENLSLIDKELKKIEEEDNVEYMINKI